MIVDFYDYHLLYMRPIHSPTGKTIYTLFLALLGGIFFACGLISLN